ncbi:hypothetical protein JCM15519_27850 [Fundidesulfovibrio butyratiphilus]
MKVSVVVPTYNQAQYLPACLDSLWFQDHPDMEIVVVDDGSTDGTARVLEGWLARVGADTASYASRYDETSDTLLRVHHPRYPARGRAVRVIAFETNRGLAAALNAGFRAATGQAVTYVPSDDWCMPGLYVELVRALEETPADFVFADMLVVNDAFEVVRRFDLPDYSFARSFCDWYLCGDAKLYRRSLHERHGFYDESLLAHDHDLFLRFALGGARFVHVGKALYAKRDHAGEREVHIHAPENWRRLIGESKRLVLEARRHLDSFGNGR